MAALRHIAVVNKEMLRECSHFSARRSRRLGFGDIRDSMTDACTLRPCTFQFGRRDDSKFNVQVDTAREVGLTFRDTGCNVAVPSRAVKPPLLRYQGTVKT